MDHNRRPHVEDEDERGPPDDRRAARSYWLNNLARLIRFRMLYFAGRLAVNTAILPDKSKTRQAFSAGFY